MRRRRLNSGYSGNTDQRRTKAGTVPSMKHYMERCEGNFFGFELWTPSQLNTQLWLDASDTSTVGLVSNTVSQWNDKSGKGRNVTQTTAGSRPGYGTTFLNNKNTIFFDGIDDSFQLLDGNPTFGTTDLDAVNTEQFSVFILAKVTSGTAISGGTQGVGGTMLAKSGGYATAATFTMGRGFIGTTNNPVNRFVYLAKGYTFTGTSGVDTAPNFFEPANSNWNIHNSNWNSTNLAYYYNTTLMPSISSVGTSANQNSIFRIGAAGTGSAYMFMGGEIAEIIILDAAVNTDNRQKMEGYLAHKWGQVDSLPENHPYKQFPPFL